jgi:tRNA pseudouridine38-40 synthase
MVRLIVGACVQAGLGQIEVNSVEKALKDQQPLKKNLSVPAHGLFLTEVKYPDFKIIG